MEETSTQNIHNHKPSFGLSNLSGAGGISQLIVDSLPQLIFWRDIDGNFIGCNKAFANLLGCASSYALQGKQESEILAMGEALGKQPLIAALFLPVNNSLNSQICQGLDVSDREIMANNQSATYVVEIPESSSKSYYQIRKYPIDDGYERLQGVITWIEDISDRYLQTHSSHEIGQETRKNPIVETALEISDRKTIEEEIQASSQELQETLDKLQQAQSQLVQSEKMSSLGQLVAGIAHEINNPVNFIYGNLDHADSYIQDLLQIVQLYQALLTDTPPEIDELAAKVDLDFIMHDLPKLLTSIKVGAERIREIVLSLRTFSRMDEAEIKAVNIHEGIDSTLMILEHRFKSSGGNVGIQVIKEYAELPLVECYPGQLNQVFMNLLSNAIDALEEFTTSENYQTVIKEKNDYQPQIKISTQINESEQIIIKIADNGYGIPEHIQTKLFDPFFTTKPIGKGTGMGLSISYKIITERHNGTIKFTPNIGQGTEFAIAIPLRQN